MLFATIAFLAGLVLGQRLTVSILPPTILMTLVTTVCAGMMHNDGFWLIASTTAVAIASLQLGYFLGLLNRRLSVPTGARRSDATSLAALPARRSVP
jgi:hypothetical protein